MNSLDMTQKRSDGVAPVMTELWGMPSTPSLSSFPGPLWSGVVASDTVLFICQKELFDIWTENKQMTDDKVSCLRYNYLII